MTATNKTLLGVGVVALILLIMSTAKSFGNIVKGKQLIRGCDPKGCRGFGESRTGHTHQGIDIVIVLGADVLSPIDGVVTRFPFPYGDDLKYTGIEIKNSTYSVKMFYLTPFVAINKKISKGDKIGTAQNLQTKWGNQMTNHVHLEVRDAKGNLINPSTLY